MLLCLLRVPICMAPVQAFDEMKAAGLQPHRQSFQSILNALAQKGSLRRIQEMADEMVAAGFDLDEHAYAALLRCYGCGVLVPVTLHALQSSKPG